MEHHARRLPHWQEIGHPLFVTFRLHGSLPTSRLFANRNVTQSGKVFAAMDRVLDGATFGARFLEQPEIAAIVVSALVRGSREMSRYDLHAYVVMPNHVHLLLTPNVPYGKWLGPLKGFTAHQANGLLRRHGEPFWQDESYDRVVRSGEEFDRIQRYIELNPVRAGLVPEANRFRWSSGFALTAA